MYEIYLHIHSFWAPTLEHTFWTWASCALNVMMTTTTRTNSFSIQKKWKASEWTGRFQSSIQKNHSDSVHFVMCVRLKKKPSSKCTLKTCSIWVYIRQSTYALPIHSPSASALLFVHNRFHLLFVDIFWTCMRLHRIWSFFVCFVFWFGSVLFAQVNSNVFTANAHTGACFRWSLTYQLLLLLRLFLGICWYFVLFQIRSNV